MLLAIDVGNTHTVFGLWDGSSWVATWRRTTYIRSTEDELAAWLRSMFRLAGIEMKIDSAICGSVVMAADAALEKMCVRWLGIPLRFLTSSLSVSLNSEYHPPTALGADRIANALAAVEKYGPPVIIVDFVTATTFDCVDRSGTFLGGAIMPGLLLSNHALTSRSTRLPHISYKAPERALGRTTGECLQSGVMLGYAGGVDALARKISAEMGGPVRIISTGGLGSILTDMCETIEIYEPTLTLDGLRIAEWRLANG
jgi:type III pantothenate kinase